MNSYTEQKFKDLTDERKARILLDLIYKLEDSWEDKNKTQLLSLFKDYFTWFNFYEIENALLKRLANLSFNISDKMSLRDLLDIAVPLERYLNLAIKDENMIKVKEGDDFNKEKKTFPLCFVLDHLRSAFNVGSLFRTAECIGVEHIYLVGYTPTPEDKGVQKTAMGTEKLVSWSTHNHMDEVFDLLDQKKYEVIALETVETATPLNQFEANKNLALLVGNERFGVMDSVLKKVDQCIEIPMMGVKNSLNVANSLSIASFEIVRQWMK